MASIYSIEKTITIEDNSSNLWNIRITGDFYVAVSTAAVFEDDEIKDVCAVYVYRSKSLMLRFMIFENADLTKGYLIDKIPAHNGNDAFCAVTLTPIGGPKTMMAADYNINMDRIEVR